MTLLTIHKRKPLTELQAAKLFREHGGICWICKEKIFGKWWDEHIIPLATGGTNDMSNRAPVHYACAREKNVVDAARTAKAKRIEARNIGYVKDGPKMKSAGFRKKPEIDKATRIAMKQAKHEARMGAKHA